ncbi:UNVERIFIED_CONTAM: hypothetical protein FKN15_072480 [Acipenser sinensis]
MMEDLPTGGASVTSKRVLIAGEMTSHHVESPDDSIRVLILGNTIQSEHSEVSGEEGSSVTLKCTYSTTDKGAYVYWYRQFPNRAPQYMVMRGAGTSRNSED